jgi:hypothetical protein
MSTLSADVRYALRGFRRTPLFTAVAVLSLAFGIGANTAVFSLLDQVLLRLLPVKDPKNLVLLTMRGDHYGSNWGGNAISYPMYKDFSEHNQVFSGMFCRFPIETSLGYGSHTERAGFSRRMTIEFRAGTRSRCLATATGKRALPGALRSSARMS